MFCVLELMYHDVKYMSYALELMFHAVEHKFAAMAVFFQTAYGNLTRTIGFCVPSFQQIGVEGLTFLLRDNLLPGGSMVAIVGCC